MIDDDSSPLGVRRPRRASLTVGDLTDDEALRIDLVVVAGVGGLGGKILGTRIQKSGLALAGHFHGIVPGRIQVLGVTEMSYLGQLSPEACQTALEQLFELDLCCVVVTEASRTMVRGTKTRAALVRCADATNTPLLLTPERSSRTITAIHALLDDRLAPRQRIHGVLVDVFEVGLLILGASGVGKSEVALELVMRGHRLVADDVVDCHYRPPGMVFGAPADLLRHHLEARGLGILNIKDLFGVTAVRERKRIDVVVRLVESSLDADRDRLGLDQRYHELLGVEIAELLIPVRPGRDMASILEIAARNELLKAAGHQPTREFFGRLEDTLLGANESEVPGETSRPPGPAGSDDACETGATPAVRQPPESSVGLPYVRKLR